MLFGHEWQHGNMAEYGNGETAFYTEQLRNVQDSERYAIHVSGTIKILIPLVCYIFEKRKKMRTFVKQKPLKSGIK